MYEGGPDIDSALIPSDEPGRLAAIRRYAVLDTPEDGAFDRITALAAQHFDVPIAIVSIVDTDRIWFTSHHGLDAREIGRDPGLCASAILQDDTWVVENAAVDPRTLANPLVAGEAGLRFYAGAPLTTHDGFNLGTLCVIDHEPRQFTQEQGRVLSDMAAIVVDELELRLASRRIVDHEQSLRDAAERIARSLQESLLPAALPEIPGCELSSLYVPASGTEIGGDFYDAFQIGDGEWALVIGDVSGKGAQAAAVTALARHTVRTAFLETSSPGEVLTTLNRAMFLGLGGAMPAHFCTVLVAAVRLRGDQLELRGSTAGHPPPLRVGADGTAEQLALPGGPPVGWHADARFASGTARLGAGDALVLYTDGLIEARPAAGGRLGLDGLAAALAGAPGRDASALAAGVSALIRAPEIDVVDDAAALILRLERAVAA